MRPPSSESVAVFICGCLLALAAIEIGLAQQQPLQFGGAYAGLGERRQRLVDDWLARLQSTTGQQLEPGPFYDEILAVSSKTTFDAVTHALMTTPLTDAAGREAGGAAGCARADRARGVDQWPDPRGVRRSPVPHLRPPDPRRAGHAGAVAGVQARCRQHRLSQGLPDQLSRAGWYAVDSNLDCA